MKAKRTEDVPHDPLTELCDVAIKAIEQAPGYNQGLRIIFFLDSDEDHRGGLVMHGYEDDSAAMAQLLNNIEAVFQANGLKLREVLDAWSDAKE